MKIWAALSGGVDSSAAALLLQRQGYEVEGAILRLAPAGSAAALREESDLADARRVAELLNIPLHVLDEQAFFEQAVIRPFIDCYEAGTTPNPCIFCNKALKFGRLMELALSAGAEGLATGHYVRLCRNPVSGRYELSRAADASKDQSYMLYGLSQETLSRCHFPLGGYAKTEIRALAEDAGLITARKHDSQDICFVPDGDYVGFMERHEGKCYPPGSFTDPSGRVLGPHRGYVHYTLGQRKGLGIASEAPLYVTRIDPARNSVTLSHGEGLYSSAVFAVQPNFVSLPELNAPVPAFVKLRYRHQARPAVLSLENGLLKAVFEAPERAVTPGQSLVAYDAAGRVLAGGIISRAE